MTFAPRPRAQKALPRQILQERAARAAARYRAGDINFVVAALMPLFEYARRSGLERSIGKGAVEEIIYGEFDARPGERGGGDA